MALLERVTPTPSALVNVLVQLKVGLLTSVEQVNVRFSPA